MQGGWGEVKKQGGRGWVGWHNRCVQTSLERVKSRLWVGCGELSVIFKPGTLYRLSRTLDEMHGREVCFKVINYHTANWQSLYVFVCVNVYICGLWSTPLCTIRPSPTTRLHCLPRSLFCLLPQPDWSNQLQTFTTQKSIFLWKEYYISYSHVHLCKGFLQILNISWPSSHWYSVDNPVCLDHRDIQVIHITESNTASLCQCL